MKKHGAFTLLEIVVAMAIFAIIAVVTSMTLYIILNAQKNIQVSSDRLSQLQMAMSLIERDISQITPRLYKNKDNALQAPIQGEPESLEFTTNNNINPNHDFPRSSLQRVKFELKDGNLSRISQDNIPYGTNEEVQSRLVLDHVKTMKIEYLSQNNQWIESWTLTMPAIYSTNSLRLLPKAIKFSIELNDWGKIEIICALSQRTSILNQDA